MDWFIWFGCVACGVVNAILGFSKGEIFAGMGWMCSAMGWTLYMINK